MYAGIIIKFKIQTSNENDSMKWALNDDVHAVRTAWTSSCSAHCMRMPRQGALNEDVCVVRTACGCPYSAHCIRMSVQCAVHEGVLTVRTA